MIAQFRKAWNKIWFEPQPPTAMALYRIFYGSLAVENFLLLVPNFSTIYGEKGILSERTAGLIFDPGAFNALSLFSVGDQTFTYFFAGVLVFAVMLTLGLFTRVSAAVVLFGLIAIQGRNPLILNGADTLLKLGAYYLMFSNAGDAFSLDRLLYKWRHPEQVNAPPPRKSPWAQRLLQFQVLLIYCSAFCSKIVGESWVNGTAVYYIMHMQEFQRITVPIITENIWICKFMTWGALIVEGAMFTLIFIRPLRYYVLALTVLLHLGIEIGMNLPIFEWLMMASLVTFIYPEDLERIIKRALG